LKTTKQSNFNNHNYSPKANIIKRSIWYFCNVIGFKSSISISSRSKIALLKMFGAEIGNDITIKPCVNIKYPWLLAIGDHSWIGENVWIDNLVPVKIGSNVCISQGAMLLTGNHNYKLETFDLITGEIVLEDGVWIGAKSIVCPGVVCKSHSILTVGSVASKNLEPYTINRGNPCEEIRKRVIE